MLDLTLLQDFDRALAALEQGGQPPRAKGPSPRDISAKIKALPREVEVA